MIAERKTLFPCGPWDEEMVWMNGVNVLQTKPTPAALPATDLVADAGGYYTLRSKESWLMVKGTEYRDRPSHADQLHVDGWWKSTNILCDPGTYSYNAPPPFDDGFAATRYHNTVVVDGRDQMTRLSRFLWGDWAKAEIRRVQSDSPNMRMLQCRHNGYAESGVFHSRLVAQMNGDTWIVVDDLTGDGSHECRLHWLTPDFPFQIQEPGVVCLSLPGGKAYMRLACSVEGYFDCVRAGETVSGKSPLPADSDRGWISRYYAQKAPALSFAFLAHSPLPIRFLTVVTLGTARRIEKTPLLDEILIDSMRIGIQHRGGFPALDLDYETMSAACVGSTS